MNTFDLGTPDTFYVDLSPEQVRRLKAGDTVTTIIEQGRVLTIAGPTIEGDLDMVLAGYPEQVMFSGGALEITLTEAV